MKRAIRNAKQPTRFADMVPFATSSSENEPPRRKRLLNDSVSIKDDIQQLKSAMASHFQKGPKRDEHVRTYSKKESKQDKHVRTSSENEPKQDEHVGKLTLPKHSLSQPLLKNISSHSKPLSTSFLQRNPLTPRSPSDRTVHVDFRSNRSLTAHLSSNRTTIDSSDCTTYIDSHRNRSITPQSLSNCTVHVESDNSPTLYSSSNHTIHESHENRSLTPHLSDRTVDVDSDYNCSLTPHSPSNRTAHVSQIDRSPTSSFGQLQHTETRQSTSYSGKRSQTKQRDSDSYNFTSVCCDTSSLQDQELFPKDLQTRRIYNTNDVSPFQIQSKKSNDVANPRQCAKNCAGIT
ncbi:uncharacterized protein LOC113005748 [Solenopsis invicta]|uniref:uncharacterized protein LOC113005748 n=1 Tax=Solenopsis invicta TaxID=13686 RepID=UPI000E33EE5B|nr:uncharacterized protein LOC113005748 [Solenopsis invicta]XP_039301966.1 uncharacterized protein LOC113005748 [Solenopsis invicta]